MSVENVLSTNSSMIMNVLIICLFMRLEILGRFLNKYVVFVDHNGIL